MKHLMSVVVCAGVLLCTGCPVMEEAGDPEAALYGRIKADLAINTEATLKSPADVGVANGPGDYMQLVSNDATGGDTLAITGRETRLGVKVKIGEALEGKVEWDFYAGAADNKPGLLLRKLYATMDLGSGMALLVGQDSDVFSPLLPALLNYGWGWNCGNAGYRRPQFRFGLEKGALQVQLAAARSIDAEMAAMPDIQARVGYKKDKLTAGVSYVGGVTDADGNDRITGVGVDFNIPIGDKLVVRGEFTAGSNLPAYLAGVGQGVDAGGNEIATTAFWIQVGVKATDKITINVGTMSDAPEAVTAAGAPEKNTCTFFLNARCKLNPKTEAGLEISQYSTAYEGDTSYDNTRVQASMILTF